MLLHGKARRISSHDQPSFSFKLTSLASSSGVDRPYLPRDGKRADRVDLARVRLLERQQGWAILKVNRPPGLADNVCRGHTRAPVREIRKVVRFSTRFVQNMRLCGMSIPRHRDSDGSAFVLFIIEMFNVTFDLLDACRMARMCAKPVYANIQCVRATA